MLTSIRDTRIFSTGCAGRAKVKLLFSGRLGLIEGDAEENTKLNDCFYEKKDWRACKNEVGGLPIDSQESCP
jgi:DNA-binding ferritin-like protein (Dps family)